MELRTGRGGFIFDLLVWDICFAGLLIGACLGLAAMMYPRWAARLVRLDEAAPGGKAEFRATYGGLFAFPHILAMGCVWLQNGADDLAATSLATGAILMLAAAWGGSAFGRLASILLDKAGTSFNWISVAFELFTAAMIGAPWIAWFVRAVLA
jgi:hypothetical protein